MPRQGAPTTGALLAVTAYLTWGLVALYWRALGSVPPVEVLGFFQYISPTCQLLIAVLVFGEPLSGIRAAAFGLVWAAVLVFSVDGWRAGRADRVAAIDPAPESDSR